MIKETNPDSSCWIKVDKDFKSGKTLFGYFFFFALKCGWKEWYRKIIGLDGSFLNGKIKGEMLVIVVENGNQQMFPILWTIVGMESKYSGTWFLQYLIQDLKLGNGKGLMIMSNIQKVYLSAFSVLND